MPPSAILQAKPTQKGGLGKENEKELQNVTPMLPVCSKAPYAALKQRKEVSTLIEN